VREQQEEAAEAVCRRRAKVCRRVKKARERFSSEETTAEDYGRTATMAAQENTEISTKFSTLNVNAVEFVPSFSYNSVVNVAEEAAAVVVAAAATATTRRGWGQSSRSASDSIAAVAAYWTA